MFMAFPRESGRKIALDLTTGKAKEEVEGVWQNYLMGLITDNERYNQVIDIWTRTNTMLTNTLRSGRRSLTPCAMGSALPCSEWNP